jgi:bifunctional non-homologous end joining protein LigD
VSSDIFELRNASPMLIKIEMDTPFDSREYIYELKLDGIRCLTYVDKDNELSDLQNKRKKILNPTYPELSGSYSQVNRRCILDGELVIMTNGMPDFIALESRAMMTNKFRIELASKKNSVQFVAYDILYLDDKPITDMPLLERKRLLNEIITENEQISVSRYITERGTDFFNLIAAKELEGIVAKKVDSPYYMGRETNRDWIKIKVLHDEDFIICGYVPNEQDKVKSVILGAYDDGRLAYQGSVALGIPSDVSSLILARAAAHPSLCPFQEVRADAVWIRPELVCSVKFMKRIGAELPQQARFKGIVLDKAPEECIINK